MKINSCPSVPEGVYQGHWGYWSIYEKPQFFMWRNFGTYKKYHSS